MEFWVTENQTDDLALSIKVKGTLFRKASQYQDIMVLDTAGLGKVLVIDQKIQLTSLDEFIYHEMIAHVPLCAHPEPRSALVIGGGDGGTVREILRHPGIRRVRLVEIDPVVLQAARSCLPGLSSCLEDPRVSVTAEDGISYVLAASERYDVIIVDSTDPVGKAEPLFEREFYRSLVRVLEPGGIVVSQTESPFFHGRLIRKARESAGAAFPIVKTYLTTVPTYPGSLWSFTAASGELDPAVPLREAPPDLGYYCPQVHAASFVLPPFVREILA